MIVFEIDIVHILAVYAESDPVVAAHPNAPFAAPVALQRMQLPAGKQTHLLDALCLLDGVEDVFYLCYEIGSMPRPEPASKRRLSPLWRKLRMRMPRCTA